MSDKTKPEIKPGSRWTAKNKEKMPFSMGGEIPLAVVKWVEESEEGDTVHFYPGYSTQLASSSPLHVFLELFEPEQPETNAVPDMSQTEVVAKLRQAIVDLTVMQYFSLVREHSDLANQFSQLAGKLVDLQTKVNAL